MRSEGTREFLECHGARSLLISQYFNDFLLKCWLGNDIEAVFTQHGARKLILPLMRNP
uniref:Uncharacterized protein n=1 Tax=Candidatus Kentrum sp. SD TaxID=2126332 RepID=A0A450YJA7_9GAMM|nr:MAG: hypothetical protein BECKSD772F_GA0070984_10969 [Candidatus Kentron sp. SD]VFK47538.1 MAG: hypothetical protein BECKSD772E_GA0070983_10979 [Candidatus Kentron sp. SD]VFK80239.1 MAG: hypothetical protein BECKSD772D_GA0070982_109510 [Candidatus Kentron sp. SD]